MLAFGFWGPESDAVLDEKGQIVVGESECPILLSGEERKDLSLEQGNGLGDC